jgi:hypothetical protein
VQFLCKQNRCPTVSLENIPFGVKPTVSHFKVFGSFAYAHIPDKKRVKLDEKKDFDRL